MFIEAAIAFAAMFALDFVWVFYTRAVTARRTVPAGGWAAGITVLNGVFTLAVVGEPWVLGPAALGAAVGTFAAMRWGHAAPQA